MTSACTGDLPISTSTSPPPSPAPPVRIDQALIALGATCSRELRDASCRWKGVGFLLAVPKTWEEGARVRHRFCDDGAAGPDLLMVTDGHSWWAVSAHNVDNQRLARAFSAAGFQSRLTLYCD